MLGRASEDGELAVVPSSLGTSEEPVFCPIRHGLRPPIFRVHVSWGQGNLLHVTCMGRGGVGGGEEDAEAVGGKVVQVNIFGDKEEEGEADARRLAYGSCEVFTTFQGQKSSIALMDRLSPSPHSTIPDSRQHVLDYSHRIKDLLGSSKSFSPISEDTRLEDVKPSRRKAAWRLLEMFYAEKHLLPWLPENLVDWLAENDRLLTNGEPTVDSKLTRLWKKLPEAVEDDPGYWEGVSSVLAVGWIDTAVKLLNLHGSFRPEQLAKREMENGLVGSVIILISKMPRMRPDLPAGKLGQCYKMKSDFVKEWEKWRGHIINLDCSAFWVQCGHRQTREGLKNLLQIMLGNVKILSNSTCHWMELYVAHFLYVRPFFTGIEGMCSLAHKCLQLKPTSESVSLISLLFGILGENIEVVLAECRRSFSPWMLAHATEVLTAGSDDAEILLHEELYNIGGISLEELNRLIYAQVLSSNALTWHIASAYLSSCPKQGAGLLEIMLYRQPVRQYRLLLKNLHICRLCDLENISSSIMKIAGMHHWKHGRRGSGIYWLQQARDEFRLNRIAQELFDGIGRSLSDDSFKQWEGLIELLGSDVVTGAGGGLEFLHKYCDFKRAIKSSQAGEASVAASQQAVQFLIQLMKNPATPRRFWLPLLHDSVKLLNWPSRPLLNVTETSLLLNKLQELSLAKLRPDYHDIELPSQALSSVRLALATNLGRVILEDD